MPKEALLWTALDGDAVRCDLCHHRCGIGLQKTGRCAVRKNVDGVLVSLNYGRTVAANVDPIEKKPLFHFLPGTTAFSVASVGCNFHCAFCQNASISQRPVDDGAIDGRPMTPEDVVSLARQYGCRSIAHTYTEPTVYFEHAIETARVARRHDVRTVFVTNGFMSQAAVEMMPGLVDAANIDLKAFDDETYRSVIGGRLQPVLDNIAYLHRAGVLVEVTTLVVTDMNDSDDELRGIAQFLVSVSPDIPWHVSRFHPEYRMLDRPATPLATIRRARTLGLEAGLRYVYAGNVPGDDGEQTSCSDCNALLVRRFGFRVVENRLAGRACPDCGAEQYFVIA